MGEERFDNEVGESTEGLFDLMSSRVAISILITNSTER